MVDYKYTVAAVLFASFSAALAGPPSYTLTSFDVPGATASNGGTVPNGINDRGAVVGVYGNGSRESGFLYSGGKFTSFDDPEAGFLTQGNCIDNRGEIVGDFFDHSSLTRGFLLSAGHFGIVDVPGALETSAQGINSSGTNIVGVFYVPRGNGQQLARGFLLKKGVFTTIVVPNTDQTYAIGVNNSGEIVGEFVRTPSSLTESFLYRRGVFSAVSAPNSRITQALGINDAGQIVGVFLGNDGPFHGFVESRGNFATVDFPGSVGTSVQGINNSGEIVGNWEGPDGGEHGFIGRPVEEVASRR